METHISAEIVSDNVKEFDITDFQQDENYLLNVIGDVGNPKYVTYVSIPNNEESDNPQFKEVDSDLYFVEYRLHRGERVYTRFLFRFQKVIYNVPSFGFQLKDIVVDTSVLAKKKGKLRWRKKKGKTDEKENDLGPGVHPTQKKVQKLMAKRKRKEEARKVKFDLQANEVRMIVD